MEDSQRVLYEGFRPGMYVRIEVDGMPCEFINNFDPSTPLVIGGLLKGKYEHLATIVYYKITFYISRHENTSSKGDFVLKTLF